MKLTERRAKATEPRQKENRKGLSRGTALFIMVKPDWYVQRLYNALCHHSLCNLFETSDVCAGYQVVAQTILFGSSCSIVVNIHHDVFQLFVNLCRGEYSVTCVLTHFDT